MLGFWRAVLKWGKRICLYETKILEGYLHGEMPGRHILLIRSSLSML